MKKDDKIDKLNRPYITVILAMSIDGKIADFNRSPAKFASGTDKLHLQTQIATTDAVMLGRGTLNAYGTSVLIRASPLLQQRTEEGKPPQPIHIICSGAGTLDPTLPFFSQPIRRWLLRGAGSKITASPPFDQVLTIPTDAEGNFNWQQGLSQLKSLGINRLAVLGGGHLISSLITIDSVDEFWLTICPLILGGKQAPTPVDGPGFPTELAPQVQLVTVNTIDNEVFLHYRRKTGKEELSINN